MTAKVWSDTPVRPRRIGFVDANCITGLCNRAWLQPCRSRLSTPSPRGARCCIRPAHPCHPRGSAGFRFAKACQTKDLCIPLFRANTIGLRVPHPFLERSSRKKGWDASGVGGNPGNSAPAAVPSQPALSFRAKSRNLPLLSGAAPALAAKKRVTTPSTGDRSKGLGAGI